jgi:ribonuclease BN (tRNA processing enzyme)
VRITVLGKSPAWQDAGGACSGYLIEEDGFALLLDCGNGVFSKLRRFRDYVDVGAVVISHLHADHCLDLVPFAYALTYAPRQQPVPVAGWPGTEHPARPELYAPPGASETFRGIVSNWGNEELIDNAFDLHEYDGTDELEVGPFTVRFCEVPHFILTFAVELSAKAPAPRAADSSVEAVPVPGNGAGRFTYSADCRPNDELVEFARDTDILLIEATLPRPERTGDRGHLTPREAGEHGRRAAASRLVITHISDELDPAWAKSEAERTFGGPVELAVEGETYTV